MRLNERLQTCGWGIFCACSWTWCIGMYLPVIMFNRYGWWGFLAFALPNVIGCAGMGYIMRSRDASARLLNSHRIALGAFSLVTIAFHSFFLSWLLTELGPLTAETVFSPIFLAMAAVLVGIVIGHLPLRSNHWLVLATAVYLLSLMTFGSVGTASITSFPAGDQPRNELFALAPIVAFGFLLCPYLDATFHRARQESPTHHSFGVFGVTFAAMIVLTPFLWFGYETLTTLALAHLCAQSIFTVGAHTRELRISRLVCCPTRRRLYLGVAILTAAAFPLLHVFIDADIMSGESMYLRFLVFYGLVFPMYVLIFIGRGRTWAPTKRNLMIAGGLVILLCPFYEAAFIHLRTWWLIAPIALIALIAFRRSIGRPVAQPVGAPIDRDSSGSQ